MENSCYNCAFYRDRICVYDGENQGKVVCPGGRCRHQRKANKRYTAEEFLDLNVEWGNERDCKLDFYPWLKERERR